MNCFVLIFSKDRALQLDATLRSLLFHCNDANELQIKVLFTSSASLYENQYEQLKSDYSLYKFLQFHREQFFFRDLIALISPFNYILFLTDDNIFVRNFKMSQILESLKTNPDSLGLSLRLGKNTTYCYTLNKNQNLPSFSPLGNNILKFNWTTSQYDFGYPLELSSSVYRKEDILPYISRMNFQNPNTLESSMNVHRGFFHSFKPYLLCYEQAVTFSNPLNMVQTAWVNRTSMKPEYSSDSLSKFFKDGYRIDIASYIGFVPNACHQEVDLKFITPPQSKFATQAVPSVDKRRLPLISVIIPCYKQAHFLTDAVESIVKQSYQRWELIIVNDGSPDHTREVAETLIEKYPNKSIHLIEKENNGLAEARNSGIRKAQGRWILPLDSDDLFATDYIERAANIIQSNPSINLVTTNEQAFGSHPHEWIPNEYTPQLILCQNTFIYASLYKKELWEAVGGYYPGIPWGAEDWNFWISCSEVGIKHARIPEKLFYYRTHPGMTMRLVMKKHWSQVEAMIHTLHSSLFSREVLVMDHNIIAQSHPETVEKIESILSRFPKLSMPYFWRGLYFERLGKLELALTEYRKSLSLSDKDDWQQWLRINLLEKRL
jgi:glycosyltransferase involved in cell wall biosynthesis